MLKHVSYLANLRMHARGCNNSPAAAIGDHAARKGHILPVTQRDIISGQCIGDLVNRDTLAGER